MVLEPKQGDDELVVQVQVRHDPKCLEPNQNVCHFCCQLMEEDQQFRLASKSNQCSHLFHKECLLSFVNKITFDCPICHDFYKVAKI